MSGLRIVLEESDMPSILRLDEAIALRSPESPDEHNNSEALLPPLPESEEEISHSVSSSLVSTASVSALPPALQGRSSASPRVVSSPSTLKEHQQCNDLDLSSLNMDMSPFSFPSMDPPSPVQSTFPPALSKSNSSTSINTSPLKRLKSLNKGLRKFSFSRKGSTASSASQMTDLSTSTSTPTLVQSQPQAHQPKPSIYPIQTDTCLHDASSSSSTGESLRSSTFSSSAPANNTGHANHTPVSTPMAPTHIPSSSQSSSFVAKSRRRTISQSNSTTSTTPPFPSPIITLSENLFSTKKSLVSIEQNFLESLQSSGDSYQQVTVDGSVNTISLLNSSDDLIDYSVYLSEHKKSVEAAYEVSKSRLSNSGWCSGQDIENLVLHRDSVLSQIDSKLLQIEEKLNSNFNVSILNNPHVDMKSVPQENAPIKAALSPSLKDLESRCLFSTNTNLLS